MIAREIIDELGQALGVCDQAILLRRISRGVELLANKDLFDPLVGYLNFRIDQGNFIALPREVRAVLAVNINNNPAFARSRFYEFDLNARGTVLGDQIEWQWNDRCNVVVQDERKFPGVLSYRCVSSEDNGMTLTAEGRDGAGRAILETIAANSTSPVAGSRVFHEVTRIFRDPTAGECLLYCNSELVGQYYGDETEPVYRSIKLSRAVASVRIMFRREPPKITTLDSYIPLNSPMAVIQASLAAGYLTMGEEDRADACLARAEKFIKEDQSTRQEGDDVSSQTQSVGTLGLGLIHSEGISVADIYDTASEIFGRQGMSVIFKKITQAVQVLLGKAHWDGMLGMVDIYPRSAEFDVNPNGKTGHGYYCLPRFSGTPLKINICSIPGAPRNKWFDFHLNGNGERSVAAFHHWDDMGDTPISDVLPRALVTGRVIPSKVVAICDNSLDEDKIVVIHGREMLSNGQEVEVWRNGVDGWICPCKAALSNPGSDAPAWTSIDRITRQETRGFVRLWTVAITPVPATPEIDVTTVTTGFSLSGTWGGMDSSVRVYAQIFFNRIEFYGDSGYAVSVGAVGGSDFDPGSVNGITLTLDGMVFNGFIQRVSGSATTFTITRSYTPPGAASSSLAMGRMLGFWYPDEVEPSYRLIRLPGSHLNKIRVLYRKHFRTITSLFDHIPLRSSLAVENMLRAIKAQELGLVQNAMPLEALAVQYLSEDRIKEGQSEMPELEFDERCSTGGWANIS